jgi:hypothetical protein
MPRPLANSSAIFESQLLSPQSIFTANKNLQIYIIIKHTTRRDDYPNILTFLADLSPCKGHIYKNRVHFIRTQPSDNTHHTICNVLLIRNSFISQRFEYEYDY